MIGAEVSNTDELLQAIINADFVASARSVATAGGLEARQPACDC